MLLINKAPCKQDAFRAPLNRSLPYFVLSGKNSSYSENIKEAEVLTGLPSWDLRNDNLHHVRYEAP